MADVLVQQALETVVLPAGIAAAGVLVARGVSEALQAPASAAVLALAYVVAHVSIAGSPEFPPGEALEWIAYLAVFGVLPSLVTPASGKAAGTLWLLGACALAGFLVTGVRDYFGWSLPAFALRLVATAACILLCWLPAANSFPLPRVVPGVMAVVAGGGAGLSILHHSAKLAQLSGALATALAAAAALLLWKSWQRTARGVTASGGAALAAVLTYLYFYVEVRVEELALLVVAWLSVQLSRAPFARRWSGRRAMVLHTVVAAVPVVIACVLAAVRRFGDSSDPYSY
jgi:hypothetical protein